MTMPPKEPDRPSETPGGSTIADPAVFNDPDDEQPDKRAGEPVRDKLGDEDEGS